MARRWPQLPDGPLIYALALAMELAVSQAALSSMGVSMTAYLKIIGVRRNAR